MERFLMRLITEYMEKGKPYLVDLIDVILKESYPSFRVIRVITQKIGTQFYNSKISEEYLWALRCIKVHIPSYERKSLGETVNTAIKCQAFFHLVVREADYQSRKRNPHLLGLSAM